jgi:hypothetical protein
MNLELLALPSVLLLAISSLLLLISRNWRWSILELAIQYVGVFLLVALHWPLEMAVVKLVAGWMSGAVLGVAMFGAPEAWRTEERFWPSGRAFRLLAAGLVGLAVYTVAPHMQAWLPGVRMEQVWGGLILIGMGLLHLGLTAQPLRVALGLLTVLAGFEILYAVIETSTLVAGLLGGVNLGLALAGAYLLNAPIMEDFLG